MDIRKLPGFVSSSMMDQLANIRNNKASGQNANHQNHNTGGAAEARASDESQSKHC